MQQHGALLAEVYACYTAPYRRDNRNGTLLGIAQGDVSMKRRCPPAGNPLSERHAPLFGGGVATASWRSGYAEDCKSLHPGSIPGEASIFDFRNAFPSNSGNPLSINLLFTEPGDGGIVFS